MSINIRSIPNYEEIYEYVPRSQYTRNAVTSARRITKLNSEQALTGKFQPNLEAVFRISPSTSSLLNLAECYFSVTGRMQRPCDTNEKLIPALKCGPLWLLRCLNKITLEIGGTAVESIQTPALLAKLYEQLAVNYNDKENGTLIDDGFYPSTGENNFFNSMDFNPTYDHPVIFTSTKVSSQGDSNTSYAVLDDLEFIELAPNCSYTDIKEKYKAKGKAKNIVFAGVDKTNNLSVTTKIPANDAAIDNTKSWTWMFKQNLKLKDVFTCVEHLKPVYGQSVVVRLQFDSDGYTSIIDSFGGSPIIYNFEQFYLNVYQYVINVDMINKLNQIYSKPVVEIIDCMDKQIQSVPSMGEDNLCQIFIPLSLQFETEFICICLPNCISNNANNGLILGKAVPKRADTTDGINKQAGGIMQNVTWKNFTEHTPADYKFINIERISIEGDGEILYDRTFKENSYPAGFPFSLYNSPYQSLVTDLNSTTGNEDSGYKLSKVQTAPFNDYTNAYELYKQCRCYYDITEESATPFVEWLYSGFALIIPTSCFSRLTSGTQISIQILFGPGVTTDSHYSKLTKLPQLSGNDEYATKKFEIGMNERINQVTATEFRTEALKQIMVVQKYRRALVYNGFNSTSLKQITQNFEQDIEVQESNDNVTTAN